MVRRSAFGVTSVIVLALLVAALVVPSSSVAGVSKSGPTSRLTVVSSPGDPIGRGLVWTFDDTDGAAALTGGEGDVLFRLTTGNTDYEVEVAAPAGRRLATGSYQNALRAPFRGTHAGISVEGQGRGCNTATGSFLIHSISTDELGRVSTIDVSFTQYCDGAKAPLRGRLQYHTLGSQTLTSSHPVTVQGEPTTFTAHAHPGSTVTFFDGKRRIGSSRTDVNGLARFTTDTLAVGTHHLTSHYATHVSPRIAQLVYPNTTSFWFQSIGGDWLGSGMTAAYSPAWTRMAIYGTTKQLTVSIIQTADWDVYLLAPKGSTLKQKSYPHITGSPTSTAPGLMMVGGGRACTSQHGSVDITTLRAAADGAVVAAAFSFVLYCDRGAYPLRGTVHYAAG